MSDFTGITLSTLQRQEQTQTLTDRDSKIIGFFDHIINSFKGFGKFCYKNSYILSNFVMMVRIFILKFSFPVTIQFLGMEYRVSQLVRLRSLNMGKLHLDYSESSKEHVVFQSNFSNLCTTSDDSYIFIWNEPSRS